MRRERREGERERELQHNADGSKNKETRLKRCWRREREEVTVKGRCLRETNKDCRE